ELNNFDGLVRGDNANHPRLSIFGNNCLTRSIKCRQR
ncbi:unnamed protein product, partial [Rotaria socialis]